MLRFIQFLLDFSGIFFTGLNSQDLIKDARHGIILSADFSLENRIHKKIKILSSAIPEIENYHLFSYSTQKQFKRFEPIIREGIILSLDENQADSLRKQASNLIQITIPVHSNSELQFQLYKAEVFEPQLYLKNSKEEKINLYKNQYTFYRGIVKGHPNSIVSLTVLPDQIRIMISDKGGNYMISKLPEGQYIFYNDKNLIEQPGIFCGMDETLHEPTSPSKTGISPNPSKSMPGNCIPLYIECDYEMYLDLGSNEVNVINYVSALINEVATIYENEQIDISIQSIFIWTTPDPFRNMNNTLEILEAFGQLRQNDYDGRMAHFISSRNLYAGIAWLNVLCSDYFTFQADWNNDQILETHYAGPYAVSMGLSVPNVVSFPTFTWNVMVFTHELGHNLGSYHTHSCKWAGGAIDNCAFTEGPCASGPDPGINGGTIMSYCHNCTGGCSPTGCGAAVPDCPNPGINFNQGFGTVPGDWIRNKVNNANCTLTCLSGHCGNLVQDEDESGIDCGGSICELCDCTGTDINISGNVTTDQRASNLLLSTPGIPTSVTGGLYFTATQSITLNEGFDLSVGNSLVVMLEGCNNSPAAISAKLKKNN